ncbi:STAS domain-containing protein [Mycobacterium mantenii]
MKSSVAVVSVHGEIDQTNARTLTEYSVANLVRCRGLILDLTRLELFGAAGFSVLHQISVSCARAGLDWASVPGAAVSVLLRICDPDAASRGYRQCGTDPPAGFGLRCGPARKAVWYR